MYSFTGQNTYGNFSSTYATSPAAVFSAVQSQQTPHTPLNAVGGTNPTSMYASFSNTAATAPSASGYPPAYAAPTPAAYASYGQTAAAVAGLQQQQQLQSASNVVNVSGAYGNHNPSRLTDSFGSVGTVPSSIASYTSLTGISSDYTSTLRSAAPAAVVNPSNNNSFVGVTRIGANSLSSNPLSHGMPSVTGATSTPSSYSGYDVGVYAAASSYLQSKAAGTTNIWMGSAKKSASAGYGNSLSANTSSVGITGITKNQTPNRNRGQFSNKRFSGSRGSGDVQQFYCEVCKISCAGSQTYKEHVEGQKHKKKEALQKGEGQTLSKSRVSFRCETCNVTCTGKDTYDSHIRGSKHQKTANLMKKLGRAVPDTPTVLAPGEKSNSSTPNPANGAPIATVGGPAVPSKRPSVQDIVSKAAGATEAAIEAAGQKNAAVEAALAAEKDVQPVGEDYVEEERNASGKLLNYVCKLCDCKFSDPNAKNIHIKGRKHRLQYKLKVNPNLVVEMKPNQMPREMRSEFARKMRARGPPMLPRPFGPPHMLMMKPPVRPWYGLMDPGRRIETMEDKHVMAKHKMIYPSECRLNAIERLVVMTEKGLKEVSDHFANEDEKAKEKDKELSCNQTSHDRLLKGVMRVGLLAKGLLLKDDKEVELVVLCSQPPTYSLLSKVAKLLPGFLENDGDVVTVTEEPEKSALFIKQESTDIGCYVVLTSVCMRSEVAQTLDSGESTASSVDSKNSQSTKDLLPKQPCLDALAELRHAKWFQVKCASLHSAVITLRILRDIRQRIPSWQPMSAWAAELLVGKVLESCGAPLSPGDAVRRVFEAIASGILYSTGPSLKDPCEKENIDAVSNMSNQQREDITSTSQHALRLIAFNQMYKVLGVQRLPDIRFGPPFQTDRKRPRDSNGSVDDGEVVDVKKDKKDEAKGEEKTAA